jgi:putative membrane protein
MKALFVAVSAVALMASAPAFASNNHPNRTFVNQATENNLSQIQLGRFAIQKATKPDIKEFGRWVASDATVLNKALVSLHKLDGITPHPTTTGVLVTQPVTIAKGKKFDKQFLQEIADTSAKNMTMYRQVAGNTTSYRSHNNNNHYKASLRFYAADAMPMLQAHLIEARRLLKREGVTAAVPPATAAAPAAGAPAAGTTVPPAGTGASAAGGMGQAH